MFAFVILATLPMLISSAPGAEISGQQIVQSSANGEFLARNYPLGALKRGEQGRVGFKLTIEPDGSLGTCDVTESSGFAALDKETCEIILRHARLTPVRNSEGRAIRAVQPGFIVWRLPAGATKIAGTTATTMPKPDRIICKRSQTTGSLVAKTKQCMTKAEWTRTQQIYRDEAERIQGRGTVDCKMTGQCS